MDTLREPQAPGKRKISFQKIPQLIDVPNLIELQLSSYERFLSEGIREAFADISPIEDFTGNLILEFLDHSLGEPTHSIEECQDKDMTFARPLKVKVRLITKEENEIKEVKEQEIFMGDFPSMTPKGTFVINGAERVIVSQLVRSPGIYYQPTVDPTGKTLYVGMVIPNRGAWLEFESDASDIIGARIDKTRKILVTVLLKALRSEIYKEKFSDIYKELNKEKQKDKREIDSAKIDVLEKQLKERIDEDIRALFENDQIINETLEKDAVVDGEYALIEIYRKLRPGDPPSADSSRTLLKNLFFDPKRYNMAKVGRYKFNKKLGLQIVCSHCGSLEKPGQILCKECSKPLEYKETLSEEDIYAAVRYMAALIRGEKIQTAPSDKYYDVFVKHDDIDHLGNRRVRAVGELLQNQFRVGLLRLERVVRERMTVQDLETVTPQALINIRPVVAAIKEFFGSSQLSQFMDQTNSLAELTHKRRLSALGPGGLSRERAGFEVRDVHYSHYGRICPIETPEGPNIGLIGSLACFAKVNDFGFIMTPYRRVQKGVVLDDFDYLSADEEDEYIIAQANTPVDSNGNIIVERVVARSKHETIAVSKEDIEYIDISPKQVVSVATALIPFLEHDDANRALMGANMQRQGVPLIKPEAPLVGTGMEFRSAKDSGALVNSEEDGIVVAVNSNEVVLQNEKNKKKTYKLMKFKRSNAGTCVNQRPTVKKNQKVKANQVIADGASSVDGELALGRNVLVAFMPWEGYNYEDAILLSEDLVKDDVFTSIHIEEYECEARDTKLGAEEITRDIPNVGEEALKDLDERGIVRIGADVRPEDILVGKVTPKGETELTAEERLLRAIFGEKARDVRDTSMKVPHGEKGKVIDVKVFSRDSSDELPPGVNQLVRVYVAQKRKILQGDKMAGRHGNKGVIAKILPVEDMPFMPDGTPIEIVLNPLGVPSRMNIGQILETHLGLAGKALGFRIDCPVFDSATETEIRTIMKKAHLRRILEMKGLFLSVGAVNEIVDEDDPVISLKNYLDKYSLRLTIPETAKILEGKNPVESILKLAKKKKLNITEDDVTGAIKSKTAQEKLEVALRKDHLRLPYDRLQNLAHFIEDYKKVAEDGKSILFDGRTGETFDCRITIGYIYMMKLAHLVDDKIHARSTGPYSLITQQPLGGKAQFGGQRFGEMEVWALEAYGAAYTLQELLTVKSDDVVGRVKTYEAIVKGENVLEPGVPESFKVLIKELQSLCLDVRILSEDEAGHLKEIELKNVDETDLKATARDLGLDIEDEALSSI
jgi:DNA-directed RNA polymerase subunit beta